MTTITDSKYTQKHNTKSEVKLETGTLLPWINEL